MLPGPRLVPLIFLERLKGDDDHAFGAFGSKSRVDLVERACGCRNAERRRHTACKAIEIIIWPQRLRAIRCASLMRGMKIDEVEVRCVRQRVSAESAEPEHGQLPVR